MTVGSLVYTIPSGSSRTSTNTTSTAMVTSRTNETPFGSIQERIVEQMLNLELLLAKRLSRALSNGQENPTLENVIMGETLKCLEEWNRFFFCFFLVVSFSWDIIRKKNFNGFYSCLTYISSSASRKFKFYCFIKEFDKQF